MTRIGLLSDTHGYLPPQVFEHFKEVDEIWHAGDIGTVEVSDALEKFKPLRAVWGNIDGADLRVRYPEHLHFEIEQVPIFITHIGGYPPNYNAVSKPLIIQYQPHLFISGHSHILKVMPDAKLNLLHINPGACGKHGWHKISTLVRFAIHENRVLNLEVIELGKRGV
ncbi:MAG TPA: metallophosphoesterase family protein [Chitinophagaceae bacterium]|mgnify:FL=1|nr:metallophosphoesterase family protein [Chitinophagaceae bacterium]